MPGPADGGHWTRYDYFPAAQARQQAALEVCQRCPVLADCREWALSGRHLLGTIVGAICRDVCARQAIGARKHTS
jgi:transcription factor WhiB